MPLRHFLLIFNTREQELLEARDMGTDLDSALAAYAEAEREYGRDHSDKIEVVLVGSDSIETIRQTHGHYFEQGDIEFFETVLG